MPLKRRTRIKSQGKQKSSKSKESSSEDTDGGTAEEIAHRLARKYLLKSSTDTEHSDHKENDRAARRVIDPYDADQETSEVDTAASVDTASDMECLEVQPDPRVLSPSRQANVKSMKTRGDSKKSISGNRVPEPAQLESTCTYKTVTIPRQHKAKRPANNPRVVDKRPMVHTPKEVHSLQNDSGLFVSPLSKIPRHLRRMNASDTSTPTSTFNSGVQADLDDSCFGFENMVTPDPLDQISPVDRSSTSVVTYRSRSSISNVSLPKDMSATASFSSDSVKRKASLTVDVTSLVQDPQQPVKKTRRRNKIDAAKLHAAQEWAAHMAEEFDDIEMHELTVET